MKRLERLALLRGCECFYFHTAKVFQTPARQSSTRLDAQFPGLTPVTFHSDARLEKVSNSAPRRPMRTLVKELTRGETLCRCWIVIASRAASINSSRWLK